MRRPEPHHIDNLLDDLAGYTGHKPLKALRDELHQIGHRARIPSAPDSTAGPRDGPGGQPTTSDHDDGPVALTAVEAAAHNRTNHHDTLNEHFFAAISHLDQAVASLGAMHTHLAKITRPTAKTTTADPCLVCTRAAILEAGGRTPQAYQTGTVGGRLDHATPLCETHYDCVRRVFGRLPTDAEARDHDRTGRWRIRQLANPA